MSLLLWDGPNSTDTHCLMLHRLRFPSLLLWIRNPCMGDPHLPGTKPHCCNNPLATQPHLHKRAHSLHVSSCLPLCCLYSKVSCQVHINWFFKLIALQFSCKSSPGLGAPHSPTVHYSYLDGTCMKSLVSC